MEARSPQQTILIVDDTPDNIHVLSNALDAEYEVLFAAGGKQALELAASETPDLILLDIIMPHMDGYEVCARLKADVRTQDIPVIFITAKDQEDDEARGLSVGAIDYIKKPIQPAVVRQRVRNHLQLKSCRDELSETNHALLAEIHERKQAEAALRQSEQRYKDLADLLPQAIFEVNTNSCLPFTNRAALEIFGYSQEDIERGMSILDTLAKEERERGGQNFGLRLAGEKLRETEYTAQRKDGSRFPICTNSNLIQEGQKILGLRGIVTDLTERKRIEQELLRAEKLESLGILVEGLAHDFNNLLGVILGSASLLKMPLKAEDEAFGPLDFIEKAAFQASALTRQFLSISQRGSPDMQTQWIQDIIHDAVRLGLSGSNLRCALRVAEDLSPVECDSGQIYQMMANLVINAREAMLDGEMLEIEVTNTALLKGAVPCLKEGVYVAVSIMDHGIGIPAEHMSKIFDAYFSTKERGVQKGMGLGLTTAYSIAKRHKGHISVESEPGIGTIFTIFLPASMEAATEQESDLQSGIVMGGGKALFMDDEEMCRSIGEEMLNFLGYKVELATDGRDAIERYTAAKETKAEFDVVMLDLTVKGGMGGKQAIEELQKIDPFVKAIALSGYPDDPAISNFNEYGFCGALAKPYRIQELSNLLGKILPNKTSSSA